MEPYNGLQMFQNQLRGGGGAGDGNPQTADTSNREQQFSTKIPDAKLKQFFEVQSKIEPFYTGGKVVVLSPVHFACQCGPEVKLVSLVHSSFVKSEAGLNPQTFPSSNSINKIDDDDEEEFPKSKDPDTEETHDFFEILGTLSVELDAILTFDACPTTHTLITAHKSGLLRLWDGNSLEILRTIKSLHPVPITGLEIWKETSSFRNRGDSLTTNNLARGGLVWSTVGGNGLRVWDSGGSEVSKIISPGSDLPSVGFLKWDYSSFRNRDSEAPVPRLWIAVRNIYSIDEVGIGDKGQLKEWKITRELKGHLSQVTGLEWWNEGNLMISGARDKTLILWSTKSESYSKLSSIAFPGLINGMTLLNFVDLYISSESRILYFDLKKRKLGKEPAFCLSSIGDQHQTNDSESEDSLLTLSPPLNQGHKAGDELKEFFVSTHTCLLCKVEKKNLGTIGTTSKMSKKSKTKLKDKEAESYGLYIKKMFVGCLDEILDVVMWEAKNCMAVANNTNNITLYDKTTGNSELLFGHKDIILCLKAKGNFLISGSKDNRIGIWGTSSMSPIFMLGGHLGSVSGVAINPINLPSNSSEADTLVFFSVSADKFLKCWTGNKCTKSVVAHSKEVHVVNCSPNGKFVVTGSRDKKIKIWESSSLEFLTSLNGHKKAVWDARFSEWDQLLATGSADATIKIWNLQDYSCIQTLQGHESSVLRVQFINSGLQVISCSTDGTWRSWDLRNSVCLSVLEGSDCDKVWALYGSSDGNEIITGSGDSKLILWKDVTQSKVEEALTKRNQMIEDEQELQNVLSRQDWTEGVRLAVELDKPFTLLRIIREVPEISELKGSILDLLSDYSDRIMGYIEKWNTNGKTSIEAQTLLHLILRSLPPAQLHGGILKSSGSGVGIGKSLIPYSEKHFNRLVKAQHQISLVQFLANQT